ncbi:AAA family ATPase [Idiomarina loihiensis]|uniref:AAA family ATPase n=1 Tax=Idiomarina loihiensis TaxID=135577 RepID=UPI002105B8BF|nr:AAA family ATPase [Idiomarina loihiensis]UTW32806.1 AAA family ATPase [Idiomarina loihiensis]
MKLDYLEIRDGFKNIQNLKLDFDDSQLLTVLIGRNGSGKSNVIEALVRIFRALDLGGRSSV